MIMAEEEVKKEAAVPAPASAVKKKKGSGKKKERKGKKPKSKSKHKNVQIWTKYKDGKVQGIFCPRCGPGHILAKHENRETCGKCHYSKITLKK